MPGCGIQGDGPGEFHGRERACLTAFLFCEGTNALAGELAGVAHRLATDARFLAKPSLAKAVSFVTSNPAKWCGPIEPDPSRTAGAAVSFLTE